jgi:hypothetical protein
VGITWLGIQQRRTTCGLRGLSKQTSCTSQCCKDFRCFLFIHIYSLISLFMSLIYFMFFFVSMDHKSCPLHQCFGPTRSACAENFPKIHPHTRKLAFILQNKLLSNLLNFSQFIYDRTFSRTSIFLIWYSIGTARVPV